MGQVIAERMTAQIEGDFVVFLIGMRPNKIWKFGKWMPVAKAMARMLKELHEHPAEKTGFLGYTSFGRGGMVQYWRSFDHLEAYARAQDQAHFPEWRKFNKLMRDTREDVGIWHETYLVRAGEHESVYSGMPPFGLGAASELVPATGALKEARGRLRAAE